MSEKHRILHLGTGPFWRAGLVAALAMSAAAACRARGNPSVAPGVESTAAPVRYVTDQFTLPDDLEVTLWAESPMFMNPTNIDVDARGRVWVTEAVNYRSFKEGQPSRPGGDRVVILEDTDGNGAADLSKVFVQDTALVAPLGMAVIGNQIVVSSSPSVIIYTDANGDDTPDRKEVFLTGFGGLDHDHGLHAVVAGPDGRWYLNAGNAGPHIVTDKAGWTLRSGSVYNGGTPYMGNNRAGLVSDDGRIWTGGVALRVRPDGTGLEVLGHNFRNSYEVALDSYGNLWQTDNDDAVVTTRTTWLMEGGNAGFFSADGSRTWQADRRPGQDLFTAHWHQEDPGVIPAGDRVGAGAPTGIVMYESDALGPRYQGMLLSGEAGRNVVFGYGISQQGAGFRLDRFDFLSSVAESPEDYVDSENVADDLRKWFRPSDVAVGTDGAIYVADWYDPRVGGHRVEEMQATGRIYRIAPRGRRLTSPKIDLSSTTGQIQALLSPAVNVRSVGAALLEAKGAAVLPQVKALLSANNEYHRARAVWLLARLGPEGRAEVERLLGDPNPNLRLTAFRALRQVSRDVLTHARRLARDSSPAVRREVAIALRDVPLEQSRQIIVDLAERFDGEDRWCLEALGMAMEGKEEALYPLLNERLGNSDPAKWDARFSALAWRMHPKAAVGHLKARAASPAVSESDRQRALVALAFIDDPAAAQAMADLTHSDLPHTAAGAAWWLGNRRGNEWHDYAVQGAAEPSGTVTAVTAPELLRLLADLRDETRPFNQRVDAAVRLAEDPVGGALVIGMYAEGGVSANITRSVRQSIFKNPDRIVRALAEQFFGSQGNQGNQARGGAPAALVGDANRGQSVFYANCASCHKAGGVGAEVGPDLTLAATKFDRAALLEAIMNPSADLAHGFEPNALTTKDGSVMFGFVLSEGPTVVFKDALGRQHTIERERIESIRPLKASIMPRPSVLGIGAQEVADVAAYLMRRE